MPISIQVLIASEEKNYLFMIDYLLDILIMAETHIKWFGRVRRRPIKAQLKKSGSIKWKIVPFEGVKEK